MSAAWYVDDGARQARRHGVAIEAGRDHSVAQRRPKRCDCVPAGCEAHACAPEFPGSDAYPAGATVKDHGRLHRHQARARAAADTWPFTATVTWALVGGRCRAGTAAGQGCDEC